MYAAYLYDAVMLYAKAAHKVIEEGGNITNGTAIIENILGSNYTGNTTLHWNEQLTTIFRIYFKNNRRFIDPFCPFLH